MNHMFFFAVELRESIQSNQKQFVNICFSNFLSQLKKYFSENDRKVSTSLKRFFKHTDCPQHVTFIAKRLFKQHKHKEDGIFVYLNHRWYKFTSSENIPI